METNKSINDGTIAAENMKSLQESTMHKEIALEIMKIRDHRGGFTQDDFNNHACPALCICLRNSGLSEPEVLDRATAMAMTTKPPHGFDEMNNVEDCVTWVFEQASGSSLDSLRLAYELSVDLFEAEALGLEYIRPSELEEDAS